MAERGRGGGARLRFHTVNIARDRPAVAPTASGDLGIARYISLHVARNQDGSRAESRVVSYRNSRYRYHFLLNPKTRYMYTHTDAVTVGALVAARAEIYLARSILLQRYLAPTSILNVCTSRRGSRPGTA